MVASVPVKAAPHVIAVSLNLTRFRFLRLSGLDVHE